VELTIPGVILRRIKLSTHTGTLLPIYMWYFWGAEKPVGRRVATDEAHTERQGSWYQLASKSSNTQLVYKFKISGWNRLENTRYLEPWHWVCSTEKSLDRDCKRDWDGV
jgi:hypothetical protein